MFRRCSLTAAMTVFSAADALAWSRFHDYVYANSFGNLVIQSPNGYKRIVVGQGHLAGSCPYEGVTTAMRTRSRLPRRGRWLTADATATATGRRISSRAAATCTACRTAWSRKPLASSRNAAWTACRNRIASTH